MAKLTFEVPEDLLGDVYHAVGAVLQRAQDELDELDELSGRTSSAAQEDHDDAVQP